MSPATRGTSTVLPPSASEMRPSCGSRFSAMSSRAITLTRETMTGIMRAGKESTSRRTPSILRRTESDFS